MQCFMVQSAYILQRGNYHLIVGDWKKIWDWKGPHKIQTFIWIAALECLLRNYCRSRRGIEVSPISPICGNGDETIIHVLCHCVYATQIFIRLMASNHITNFFSLICRDWIFNNLIYEKNRAHGDLSFWWHAGADLDLQCWCGTIFLSNS